MLSCMKALKYRCNDFPTFLEITGLWLNPLRGKWLYLLKFWAYFCVIVECLQIISMFWTEFDRKTLQEEGFFSMMGIITSWQVMHIQKSQLLINKVLSTFSELRKRYTEDWEKELYSETCTPAWKLVNAYWWILMGYCSTYAFLPVVVDYVGGCIFPSFPRLRVPIPLHGFIKGMEPRSMGDLLLSLVGALWTTAEIVGHIGVEMGLYLLILYTKIEIKVITKKINIMQHRMKINRDLNYQTELKDIAKRHQEILRILELLIELFGVPIAVQNTVISVCICVNVYSMTNMENNEELPSAMQNTFALVVILGFVFFVCNTGQSLEKQNEVLFHELYDLPWYEQGPGFRKDLLMILRQTRKPLVIHYHRRSSLTVTTFMEIINTSYSYFMMLKSTM